MRNIAKILVLALVVTLPLGCPQPKEKVDDEDKAGAETGEKVALDFHIMSKCPFGVKVVQAIAPVMEKMGGRIDLNIHYIGREKDGELTSMHGPQELNGDIVQLCADELGDDEECFVLFVCCPCEFVIYTVPWV